MKLGSTRETCVVGAAVVVRVHVMKPFHVKSVPICVKPALILPAMPPKKKGDPPKVNKPAIDKVRHPTTTRVSIRYFVDMQC